MLSRLCPCLRSPGSPQEQQQQQQQHRQEVAPAHAKLEMLAESLVVVVNKPADQQHDALQQESVLKQLDEVLDSLEAASQASPSSKSAGKVADALKTWGDVFTAAVKEGGAGVKDAAKGAYGAKWDHLVEASGQLLTAGSTAAYVGPLFALVGLALKQWSAYAKVPSDVFEVMRGCRDLLEDIDIAYSRLTSREHHDRFQALARKAAELLADTIVIRTGSCMARVVMAQVYKEDLDKKNKKLEELRSSFNTRLLLPPYVERKQLDIGAREVFGMTDQLHDVLLRMSGAQKRGVWLYGMGGSGKTTLAKLLYNESLPQFDYKAHVEVDTDDARTQLQERLVSILKQLSITDINVYASLAELQTVLKDCTKVKPVLLLVDNICTEEQLHTLLPPEEDIVAGSRVIITSRLCSMPSSERYQGLSNMLLHHRVVPLDPVPASQLFCSSQRTMSWAHTEQLQQLENKIVEACAALPLALKLTGAQLKNVSDPDRWEHMLKIIAEGAQGNYDTETKLQGLLSSSFERISKVAQHIFLDIVSVMHGRSSHAAKQVWDTWPKLGGAGSVAFALDELQDRCLVDIDQRGMLQVHDVLRTLGRRIIRDDKRNNFYGSRAWVEQDGQLVRFEQDKSAHLVAVSAEGIKDVGKLETLLTTSRTADLRILLCPGISPICNVLKLSAKLAALQLLDLRGCHALHKLPECGGMWGALQLNRWLRLSMCCVLAHLPESFGRLGALLQLNRWLRLGTYCTFAHLQHLDLSECTALTQLPESFGGLGALQHLDLGGCAALSKLPKSFGGLEKLQHLKLSECCRLTQLPESFGGLGALQHLDLGGCVALSKLPESFGGLGKLQHLNLSIGSMKPFSKPQQKFSECCRLTQLPESFGSLGALKQLNLSYRFGLKQLPESFGSLGALEKLNVSNCRALTRLPESFGCLAALQQLDLTWCTALTCLPESFGGLQALQELDMTMCSDITALPASFTQLSQLRVAKLRCLDALECLPTGIGNLTALQELDLTYCLELEAVPAEVKGLHTLLLGFTGVAKLPSTVSALKKLQVLDLSGLEGLKQLPEELGQLPELQELLLCKCTSLQALPESITQLSRLRVLDLEDCKASQEVIAGWASSFLQAPADPVKFDVVAWGCQNPAIDIQFFCAVDPPLLQFLPIPRTATGTAVRYIQQESGQDCISALDYSLGRNGMQAFKDVQQALFFNDNGQICSRFRVALAEGSRRRPVGGVPLVIRSGRYNHPNAIWVHFRKPVTGDLVLQRSDGGAFRDVWLTDSHTRHVQGAQHILFD